MYLFAHYCDSYYHSNSSGIYIKQVAINPLLCQQGWWILTPLSFNSLNRILYEIIHIFYRQQCIKGYFLTLLHKLLLFHLQRLDLNNLNRLHHGNYSLESHDFHRYPVNNQKYSDDLKQLKKEYTSNNVKGFSCKKIQNQHLKILDNALGIPLPKCAIFL